MVSDLLLVPNNDLYTASKFCPTLSRIVTTLGKFDHIDPDVSITKNIVTKYNFFYVGLITAMEMKLMKLNFCVFVSSYQN